MNINTAVVRIQPQPHTLIAVCYGWEAETAASAFSWLAMSRRDACLDDLTWASLADVFCSCSRRADVMTRRGFHDRTWRGSCLGWTGYPQVPSRWLIHKYYACTRKGHKECTD